MDTARKKPNIDPQIESLKRDGTMATFNKATQLLFEYKGKLTVEQRMKLESKMQCLVCDRVYCDHPRPR